MTDTILQIDFHGPKWPGIKGKIRFLKDNCNVKVICRKATMGFGDEDYTEIGAFKNECDAAGVIDALYSWPDVTAPIDDQMRRIAKLESTFSPHWWGMDIEQWWADWTLMYKCWANQIPQSAVPKASPDRLWTFMNNYAQGMFAAIGNSSTKQKPMVVYTNIGFVGQYCPKSIALCRQFPLWDASYPFPNYARFNSATEMAVQVLKLPRHTSTIPGIDPLFGWQFASGWYPYGLQEPYDLTTISDAVYARMSDGIVIPDDPPPTPLPILPPELIGIYNLYAQYSWPCFTTIRDTPNSSGNTLGYQGSRFPSLKLIPILCYDIINGWYQIDPLKNIWISGANLTKVG